MFLQVLSLRPFEEGTERVSLALLFSNSNHFFTVEDSELVYFLISYITVNKDGSRTVEQWVTATSCELVVLSSTRMIQVNQGKV